MIVNQEFLLFKRLLFAEIYNEIELFLNNYLKRDNIYIKLENNQKIFNILNKSFWFVFLKKDLELNFFLKNMMILDKKDIFLLKDNKFLIKKNIPFSPIRTNFRKLINNIDINKLFKYSFINFNKNNSKDLLFFFNFFKKDLNFFFKDEYLSEYVLSFYSEFIFFKLFENITYNEKFFFNNKLIEKSYINIIKIYIKKEKLFFNKIEIYQKNIKDLNDKQILFNEDLNKNEDLKKQNEFNSNLILLNYEKVKNNVDNLRKKILGINSLKIHENKKKYVEDLKNLEKLEELLKNKKNNIINPQIFNNNKNKKLKEIKFLKKEKLKKIKEINILKNNLELNKKNIFFNLKKYF